MLKQDFNQGGQLGAPAEPHVKCVLTDLHLANIRRRGKILGPTLARFGDPAFFREDLRLGLFRLDLLVTI